VICTPLTLEESLEKFNVEDTLTRVEDGPGTQTCLMDRQRANTALEVVLFRATQVFSHPDALRGPFYFHPKAMLSYFQTVMTSK
jgi:hypothetical protein